MKQVRERGGVFAHLSFEIVYIQRSESYTGVKTYSLPTQVLSTTSLKLSRKIRYSITSFCSLGLFLLVRRIKIVQHL